MSHDCENKDFIDCGGTARKPCKTIRDKRKKQEKLRPEDVGP